MEERQEGAAHYLCCLGLHQQGEAVHYRRGQLGGHCVQLQGDGRVIRDSRMIDRRQSEEDRGDRKQ